MIWFAWRQFRLAACLTLAGLAVIGALLALSGHSIADYWTTSGAAACRGAAACDNAISFFLQDATSDGLVDHLYNISTVLLYLAPPLVGVFWGAPLVARELENGTHQLAWNQSVTRTRWLATRLAVTGGAALVAVGALAWSVTVWAGHIDANRTYRVSPILFGARGVVPVAYTLFALALGVTLGVVIRRAVPAMIATAAAYAAVVVAWTELVRSHLLPAAHAVRAVGLAGAVQQIKVSPVGIAIASDPGIRGAWILSDTSTAPSGGPLAGPLNPAYCGPSQDPNACIGWLKSLGVRQDVAYQPASHFWGLQGVEAGVFAVVAVALLGLCFAWTRRRLS
jgi:hypothetical protein